jgi:drug/metabolite transporter (DMT)-like permease
LLTGTLLFLGCHAVLAWGEQRVPSGQAALLLAGIPLWLTLLEAWRTSRWPALRVWLGLSLGLGGVGLLAARTPATGDLFARGALVLCGRSWAVGSLIARDGERPSSSAQATAMQLIAGAVAVGTLSGVLGEWKEWQPEQLTARAALALVFLSVCGTAMAFGAYTWLLQVASPTLVGTYAFVNPVVPLGLAWLTGDE